MLEQVTNLSRHEETLGKAADAHIRIESVTKTYVSDRGDVTALANLTFDIRKGEFLSIVGPSGCGKSTLMRCIAGLAPVSSGNIFVNNKRVDAPLKDIGIVFQRDLLLDWRTVIGNVLFAVEFREKNLRQWNARADELLHKVHLEEFRDRYPWELSGGMRQRVAICRALLSDPSILLMDEPFGALDALTRDELNAELQRIWIERHKTVVFITHSISESVFLSDRVVVMSKKPGQILETIDIPLQRPRKLAIRDTAEFGALSAKVRRTFAESGSIPE